MKSNELAAQEAVVGLEKLELWKALLSKVFCMIFMGSF